MLIVTTCQMIIINFVIFCLCVILYCISGEEIFDKLGDIMLFVWIINMIIVGIIIVSISLKGG